MAVTFTASANATPASGVIVATCTIGGADYQQVIPTNAAGNSIGVGAASPLFVSACLTNFAGSAAGSPIFSSITNLAGSAAGSPLFASITNIVSASIGSGSVALLTGANMIGSASVIQSTPAGMANAWPIKITDGTNIFGPSNSPLAVTFDVQDMWWNGSLLSSSNVNLSSSVSGCTRMVASSSGKAIVVVAVTYTTSSCQFIGWIASGAGAASAVVQTAMPFGTFGGMDVNRTPHILWSFPSGSNAVMTTTSACNVAGNLSYLLVAS